MENQFQAEVCGSNYWWNPARSMFSYSPCSSGGISEFGGFGLWPNDDLLDMKTRSGGSASDGSSIVIQDHHIQNQQPDSVSGSSTSSLSMDSTLEILGIGLSSSSSTDHHWNNPANLFHGRSETTNYPPILQEHRNSRMNYGQETGVNCPSGPIIQKDWSTDLKNFSNEEFSLESPTNSTGFPISSVSYGYSSTLLQTLFDSDPQPQQSLYGNGSSMNHPTNNSTNYLPKTNHFQFLNNTTNFSNAYSAPPLNDFRPNLFAPSTFNQKASLPNLKSSNEEVKGLGSVAKKTSNSEPAFKRPRIETPSPLPTFKVRKEKLGDRITALQQLVSPFGKTDTASVLHEAIEYIKFLHDQVGVLSTPYLRNGSPIQQRQQTCDIKTKDQEGAKQDLKSRGLCLVPISSTFPVAAETTTDFWTPTFGGTFR